MVSAGQASGARILIFPFMFLIYATLASASSAYSGDGSRYFPLDHPVYDYLYRLQERGRLTRLNPSLRPYTRLEVLEAVREQSLDGLRQVERDWLERIRAACEFEINAASGPDSAQFSVITRLEAMGRLANIRPGRSRSSVGAGFGGRFGHLVFDSRFLRAPHLMQLEDTTAHRDPGVQAPLEEGLIRPMEGYLKGDFRLFGGAFSTEFFLGRLARNWSPTLNHSLILGSDAQSFDQLAFCLRSRHLTFSHLVASLDGMSYRNASDGSFVRAKRFFTAHRLDIRVRDHLRFGITETTVYGGQNRGFDLALANPFTSYRLVAIQNKRDYANNTFVSLDGFYNHKERLTFFGQILFDDLLRDDKIQDRWALDLGLNLRDFPGLGPSTAGVRAIYVSSFAYNTFQPYERYLFNGRPLGAPLGNDYWKVYGFLRFFTTSGLDLTAHFARIERGNQRIASPVDQLLDSAGLDFPTPVVERRFEAGLALRWQIFEQAHLEAEGGIFKEENFNNQPGKNRCRGYASLYLAVYHDLIISF